MQTAPLRVLVLGSLQCWANGQRVQLVGPRHERLLATLAIDAGRTVSLARLVDAVWEDDPPATARRQVQDLVSRLRRGIREAGVTDEVLTSERDGYLLRAEVVSVDALEFEAIAAGTTGCATPVDEIAELRRALALWRGPALDGLDSGVLSATAAVWQERRATVWEHCLGLELDLGDPLRLVPELTDAVAQHPLRERPTHLLMRALAACGRRADALEAYERFRQRLADELGLDPEPELQRLHRAILRGEPTPASISTYAPPAQLPVDGGGFVGRTEAIRRLDLMLADAAVKPTIAVVSGTAGVGKTALAVHWAHRVSGRFPNGQLYVNLRGFDAGSITPPEQVIREFLDALGVPAAQIPGNQQAQHALYRRMLAGRRMLIVLDNARDADQVRPLLPTSPGCLVLVTSRNQLVGLVAVEGAHPVSLDVLDGCEARALLAARLGAQRLTAEEPAVAQIVDSCAGLPLALTVVAVRAAVNTRLGLGALAQQLQRSSARLDGLTGADPSVEIRSVFSWSYRTLTPPAARLFRLLGLHPGPDIGVPAVASLAGSTEAEVRPLLNELAAANLVIEHVVGRYALHDLLRAYAAELVGGQDDDAERDAAATRLLDHYLQTAYASAWCLSPNRTPIEWEAPSSGIVGESVTDHDAAFDWFTAERRVLLQAVEYAAAHRYDRHAWQLAWCAATYLDRCAFWVDWAAMARTALDAAQRLGDRAAQAQTERLLARAYGELGERADALMHYERAIELDGVTGNYASRGAAYLNRASLYDDTDRRLALQDSQRALDDFRHADLPAGQAAALNAIAWHLAQLGEPAKALGYAERSLALHRVIDHDIYAECAALDTLGRIYSALDEHDRAIDCHLRARDQVRIVKDQLESARIVESLGDAYHRAADLPAARESWREALDIFTALGRAEADRVRAKLGSKHSASRSG